MILADYLFEFVLKSQKTYGLSDAEMGSVRTVLAGAYRYVFPERTTEMAETAVRVPAKIAPFLSLPAKWTWVEFADPMEGVLINGSDELSGGAAIYAALERTAKGPMITLANAAFNLPTGGFMLGDKPDTIPERFQRRLMGALTLLGAPDLLERRSVQHSRAWQANRERQGKAKALDHEVIQLHLSRYEKEQERQWAEEVRLHTGGTGTRKRHHFVRAHIRIYETGKVIKIPPHYRGDPALGEAPLTHIVRP